MNKFVLAPILSAFVVGCGGSGGDSSSPDPVDPPITEQPKEPENAVLSFVDASNELAIDLFHANKMGSSATQPSMFSAGVAAEDYDNDGDLDFYLIAGENGTNQLYQNQGDGTFTEVAESAGVAIDGEKGSGPMFADFNGDGHLDLFVGAVDYDKYYLFQSNGDGTFTDITASSGLVFTAGNSVSATAADIDEDGDLDLFISHWGHDLDEGDSLEIVWRNDSSETEIKFVDISTEMGLSAAYVEQFDREENRYFAEADSSFVPSLSDIDKDGDWDLLLVSDYGLSKILKNEDGIFVAVTEDNLIDQFGMGSAVGDIDNDGDMDWYVTSIAYKDADGEDKNPTEGYLGNMLYINDGSGNFTNASSSAGVADGGWAWGACFADFNNDSLLDIYHVNGWGQDQQLFAMFNDDENRLYINNGDGTFTNMAMDLQVNDSSQGRGLACNDFDNDGDIDIIVSNNQGRAKYFRNELSAGNNYLKLSLQGDSDNVKALGAWVEVQVNNELTLTKEVRLNNNFASQNAAELHFGLGQHPAVESVTITWPNGEVESLNNVVVNQLHLIQK